MFDSLKDLGPKGPKFLAYVVPLRPFDPYALNIFSRRLQDEELLVQVAQHPVLQCLDPVTIVDKLVSHPTGKPVVPTSDGRVHVTGQALHKTGQKTSASRWRAHRVVWMVVVVNDVVVTV